MGMARRLEQLRVGEHRRLRQAMGTAFTALKEAERRRIEVPVPQVDIWGEPIQATREAPRSLVNLRPLFDAWGPFETGLQAHLDSWDKVLAPLVLRWEKGQRVGNDVVHLAALLRSRRRQLEAHVNRVRSASRFVSELRPPMLALFSALEASDRVEEGEVLAVLLSGGDPDSFDSAPRHMTSDDITRRLRSSIDSEPYYEEEPEEEVAPEPTLWDRLRRWVTGS